MNAQRLILVACLGVVVMLGIGIYQYQTPEQSGRREAKRDLEAGRLKLKTIIGPGSASFGCYARLMHDKLGVEVEIVGACVVGTDVIENARGYNAIIEKEIARRFGPDAHELVSNEAETQHQNELDAWRRQQRQNNDEE